MKIKSKVLIIAGSDSSGGAGILHDRPTQTGTVASSGPVRGGGGRGPDRWLARTRGRAAGDPGGRFRLAGPESRGRFVRGGSWEADRGAPGPALRRSARRTDPPARRPGGTGADAAIATGGLRSDRGSAIHW